MVIILIDCFNGMPERQVCMITVYYIKGIHVFRPTMDILVLLRFFIHSNLFTFPYKEYEKKQSDMYVMNFEMIKENALRT